MQPTDTPPIAPFDRMAHIQQSFNTPTACEVCGSTMFYEATLNQYAAGRYSSGSGGDLSVISTMPQQIIICVCGEPRFPNLSGIRGGRTANQEMAHFSESMQKAKALRKQLREEKQSAASTLDAATSDLVSKKDLEELKEEVVNRVKLYLAKQTAAAAAKQEEPAAPATQVKAKS